MKKLLIMSGIVLLAIVLIVLLLKNSNFKCPCKKKTEETTKPTLAYELDQDEGGGSNTETGNTEVKN